MVIEFETKKGKFLAVKPTKSVSYMDDNEILIAGHILSWMNTNVTIPEKGFSFNCLLSELTKSKCKKIVDNIFNVSYKNYLNPSERITDRTFDFDNALDSFKTLMEKIEIYTVNPFEKPNPNDYCDDFGNYEHNLQRWKAAQKRTSKEWLILKIKK